MIGIIGFSGHLPRRMPKINTLKSKFTFSDHLMAKLEVPLFGGMSSDWTVATSQVMTSGLVYKADRKLWVRASASNSKKQPLQTSSHHF